MLVAFGIGEFGFRFFGHHDDNLTRGSMPNRLARILGMAIFAAALLLLAAGYIVVGCSPEIRVISQFFR